MTVISRTFGEVFEDLFRNLQEIVRSEIRLAKSEVREQAAKAKVAGVLLGAGALLGFFALAFTLLTIVAALTVMMPLWQATLSVTVALLALTGLLIALGLQRIRTVHAVPQRTIDHVKGDIQWVKQHAK